MVPLSRSRHSPCCPSAAVPCGEVALTGRVRAAHGAVVVMGGTELTPGTSAVLGHPLPSGRDSTPTAL